jgi:hypothetical protein
MLEMDTGNRRSKRIMDREGGRVEAMISVKNNILSIQLRLL